MKILSLLFLCLSLTACDGIQFEDEITAPSDTKKFTPAELKNNVLFSSDLLGRNIQNTFMLLFDSIKVEEIVFNPDNNKVLTGKYNWEIVNDKLQVSYPSGVTCTSEKKDSDNQKIEVKTVVCEGGDPKSAKIDDTLNKALSITTSNLSGDTITIEVDDTNNEVLTFDSNNGFTLTRQVNGQDTSTENGSYKISGFNNIVQLDFNGLGYYRLFILMQGSLSSGQLADLRYNETSNLLEEVRLMNILSSESWKVDESIGTVEFDN
jgi:hypothetical protein